MSAVDEAERNVLGALLSAGSYDVACGFRVMDRVLATGLDPAHFYRWANGILFGVLVERRVSNLPLDPVCVAADLEARGAEPHVIGRLHQLACEVVAFSPAPHWARIVIADGKRRQTR